MAGPNPAEQGRIPEPTEKVAHPGGRKTPAPLPVLTREPLLIDPQIGKAISQAINQPTLSDRREPQQEPTLTPQTPSAEAQAPAGEQPDIQFLNPTDVPPEAPPAPAREERTEEAPQVRRVPPEGPDIHF